MNPILVESYRGGITESFHRGVICVVDDSGKIIYSIGDTSQICYPRSALKYLQHIPLIVQGITDYFQISEQELALMCGSHNGEDMHINTVRTLLHKIGCSENELQCGAQNPTRKSDWIQLIKLGDFAKAVHNNCSGKHAGFLAFNAFHQLTTHEYLSPQFILQEQIKQTIARFAQLDPHSLYLGIDGCSAPTYALSVYHQALMYKNLVSPHANIPIEEQNAAKRIVQAVAAFPEMIAGTKRYCTDLMRVTKGRIIGKTGADGVYCLSIPDKKWGISIKVDDGKMGPQYQIAQALLTQLELLKTEEIQMLDPYQEFDILNFAGNIASHTRVVNLENEAL